MQEMNYWTTPGMNVDSPEGVLTEVCRLTGTDPDIIKSKSRRLDVVIVRQVYCYTARELTGASMKEIGEVINRDHATVIYSCKRVKEEGIESNDWAIMPVYEKVNKTMSCGDRITAFIQSIRESFPDSVRVYTLGSCYRFYLILKNIYPAAEPYYNIIEGHVITKIDGRYYDITGEVSPDGYFPLHNELNILNQANDWMYR
jgi:hypothetical protein